MFPMHLRLAGDLPFDPFQIDHLVDAEGRYQVDLDPRFPLLVNLFSFAHSQAPFSMNWHERLELFVPVEGKGKFRMGDRVVPFSAGDVLVVDVRSMHGVLEFAGGHPRGIVITFLPELVCSVTSADCDSQYLTPFYCQTESVEPALRRPDRFSAPVHTALRKLLACYFGESEAMHREAGCKVYLLEVLYLLSLHFGHSAESLAVYQQQRLLTERFRHLHEWLAEHYAEKITVAEAASRCAMSESQFMKAFKKATNTTFIRYVTQIRLNQSLRLLRESALPISEIAARLGFSDQSYFDRRFKERFGETPIECRRGAQAKASRARLLVTAEPLQVESQSIDSGGR